jgi:hypothetical protein
LKAFPFPKLFGAPTKLDYIMPELCSNCGASEIAAITEVHLYMSRSRLRLAEYPGFVMDAPLCKLCFQTKVRAPVTLYALKKNFMGKVKCIFLRFDNHEYAQAFKTLNNGLIVSGWVRVIDGGIDV